jgi:hypothetical protein
MTAQTKINETVADAIIRRGVSCARPPVFVAEGVTWGQMFFGAQGADISEPPCNGWGTAFVLDDGGPTVRIFHLWSMSSWQVRRDCGEMLSYQGAYYGGGGGMDFPLGRFREKFPQYYAEFRRRGETACDYDTCVKLMGMLDIPVPTSDRYGDFPAVVREQPAGKSAAVPKPEKAATGFVKVKREGRKGEVLAFFLDGGSSAAAAIARFGITRSNLLSQLFLLNKNHGIGYHVKGDLISVELPEGVEDPFA